jgi:hypothetical protein
MLHKVNNRAVEGLNTLSFINKAQEKGGRAIPYEYVFMVKLAIGIGIIIMQLWIHHPQEANLA